MKYIISPSPNWSVSSYKKVGAQIHKTLGNMPWTLQWLRNPNAWASANVLFARNGDVHELVPLDKRAWGAGRLGVFSQRAKNIYSKYGLSRWVKPGHYFVQCEFECLLDQTFTEEQYKSAGWYFKNKAGIEITKDNLLEHQDTAPWKPDLEKERAEILKRLDTSYKLADLQKQLSALQKLVAKLVELLRFRIKK